MLDRETLLTLFNDAARNLVFNLDFIPADRLDWKPAPEAKSALEIVNHLGEFLNGVSGRLSGKASAFTPATSAEEAKQSLSQAVERFSAAARGASSDALGETFREGMPFTTGWIVTAAVIDTIYHGGQIAYLQTLLGDTEIHFDQATLPGWSVS